MFNDNYDFDKAEKTLQEIESQLPEKIDTSKFEPMTLDDLSRILGLTIKRDDINKILTFLCQLSIYTEDNQFNISFNAPSSSGKSYIPLEISRLFPPDDVIKLGGCSPTAFFHENGSYDKEKNIISIDLSKKVIIFLDQPNNNLLARLRPLLSHDEKVITSKITDKNQKGGNRTKTVAIKGYPSVIFCTAGLRVDEQEATRCLLLSPEIDQEKIQNSVYIKILKEADKQKFYQELESNQERQLLKERIRAIKQANIQNINIDNPEEEIFNRFKELNPILKKRHARDIGRVLAVIKSHALLNLWFRELDNSTLMVNEDDIQAGFALWNEISISQDYNLPPYIYNLYIEVILAIWKEKQSNCPGLTRQEISSKHYQVYSALLPDWQLRQQIIPMLETAGLIRQEPDPVDRRKILIIPTNNKSTNPEAIYSELEGGVEVTEPEKEDLVEIASNLFT